MYMYIHIYSILQLYYIDLYSIHTFAKKESLSMMISLHMLAALHHAAWLWKWCLELLQASQRQGNPHPVSCKYAAAQAGKFQRSASWEAPRVEVGIVMGVPEMEKNSTFLTFGAQIYSKLSWAGRGLWPQSGGMDVHCTIDLHTTSYKPLQRSGSNGQSSQSTCSWKTVTIWYAKTIKKHQKTIFRYSRIIPNHPESMFLNG